MRDGPASAPLNLSIPRAGGENPTVAVEGSSSRTILLGGLVGAPHGSLASADVSGSGTLLTMGASPSDVAGSATLLAMPVPASAPIAQPGETSWDELQRQLRNVLDGWPSSPFDLKSQARPGFTHRVIYRPGEAAAVVNSFELDLRDSALRLRMVKGQPGLKGMERIEDLAREPGMNSLFTPLAGVNGGFWDARYTPVGSTICGGVVYSVGNHRWTFLMGDDGATFIGQARFGLSLRVAGRDFPLAGVNSPSPTRGLYLYLPSYGEETPGFRGKTVAVRLDFTRGVMPRVNQPATAQISAVKQGPGPCQLDPDDGWLAIVGEMDGGIREELRLGSRVEVVFSCDRLPGPIDIALCAGPLLAKDGAPVSQASRARAAGVEEGALEARTGLGISADGSRLLLLTIDGSPLWKSHGATLDGLAMELLNQGAATVLNLDGGSSTAAWAGGELANQPAALLGSRPINNALFIGERR